MFTSTTSVSPPGFGVQAPQQPQQHGHTHSNPLGRGLSTRECFAVNDDKRFDRRVAKKPLFSWCTGPAPAPMAPATFTFPGTDGSSSGLFGTIPTPAPTAGWHFGGLTDRPHPPAQPLVAPTWGNQWNPSHWNDPKQPPFAPTIERDPLTGHSGQMMSISSMPAYAHQSVEEMRLENDSKPAGQSISSAHPRDWTTNKGAASSGWMAPSPAFGSTATSTGAFGFMHREDARTQATKQDGSKAVGVNVSSSFNFALSDDSPYHRYMLKSKPKWPMAQGAVEITPRWQPLPVGAGTVMAVKPADASTSFRFGLSDETKSPPTFSLFGKPPAATEPSDPELKVKEPEHPVAVPDEDFPYGSGDFGAGLVEQTVKAILSTLTTKSDENDLLALSVPASHRPTTRVMGGSRATAFVRRSTMNNSKARLAHSLRHTIAASRKPTGSVAQAKKPIERIVVALRDAEPWKRGGLHLKTSLFGKTIESAATALSVTPQVQQSEARDDTEGTAELVTAAASGGDDGLGQL